MRNGAGFPWLFLALLFLALGVLSARAADATAQQPATAASLSLSDGKHMCMPASYNRAGV